MNDFETYLFIGGLFGIFIVLEIVMFIGFPKKISHYSLEKASQIVQHENREWMEIIIALVIADVMIWFWLGQKVPLQFFLAILLCLNLMMFLFAVVEYQSVHLSKKRILELERLQVVKGSEEPTDERIGT